MLKIGIIGTSPGNGHPYSWSAIFNGYEPETMAECPFPTIPEYLARVEPDRFGIAGAKVTHIWTQDPEVSRHIAAASRIAHVVQDMTDLVGEVDAVLLARDDGENHLRMARPFLDADLPLFVDKPLADNMEDLREFIRAYEQGKPVLSCSSTRYAAGIQQTRGTLGQVLTAHAITGKLWRTYGIHVVEGLCAVMGYDVESVQALGQAGQEVVYLQYRNGAHAVLQSVRDMSFALHWGFYGDRGSSLVTKTDAYSSFRNTLVAFVDMVKTGKPPFDWHETVATIKVVIGALQSLEQGGRLVRLDDMA